MSTASGEVFRALFKSSAHAKKESRHFAVRVQGFRLALILGIAALILVFAVVFMAWMSIQRSEKDMANLLAAKGASLLMVFESALKTGMQGETGLVLQSLLQEMAKGPDIDFVAVTMPDGVIIAHSANDRLGESLRLGLDDLTSSRLAELDPSENEKWLITESEGKKVFLLYRHFTLGSKDWPNDVPQPTIFLGMDVYPFEITSAQNRDYIILLGLVLVFVGLLVLIAIYFSQRAAELRLRQQYTESEMQRMAEEMRRSEKLAAIGTLAARVAHEIRNPLSSIQGYATYFRQKFPEGSEDREAASVMINEASRLNRVITDLLGLSRPEDTHLKPVAVQDVVLHVLRLMRQQAAQCKVQMEIRLAPQIPMIMGDMERLTQAFLNIFLNALEASPPNSCVLIAVSGGRNRICVMTRDEGCGINPDIIEKIFDPYFTTKNTGTGLGLPMVHRIVRSHKGEVDVVSRVAEMDSDRKIVRKGQTVFRIWLPVANRSGG